MPPPSAPPLPSSDTTVTLIVPTGGAAAVTLRGVPILSKRHGVADLRLHTALSFDDQTTPAALVNGAGSNVSFLLTLAGEDPAIIFEDEGAEGIEGAVLSLVKPAGASEVHVLGGRLLLDDGTDARWSCAGGGGGGGLGLSADAPLSTLEFGSSRGAVILLSQDGQAAATGTGTGTESSTTTGTGTGTGTDGGGSSSSSSSVALAISASRATLSIRGTARLMVDGTDVRPKQLSCAAAASP